MRGHAPRFHAPMKTLETCNAERQIRNTLVSLDIVSLFGKTTNKPRASRDGIQPTGHALPSRLTFHGQHRTSNHGALPLSSVSAFLAISPMPNPIWANNRPRRQRWMRSSKGGYDEGVVPKHTHGSSTFLANQRASRPLRRGHWTLSEPTFCARFQELLKELIPRVGRHSISNETRCSISRNRSGRHEPERASSPSSS